MSGLITPAHSQQITQTIRGTVIDKASRSGIPGATVVLLDTTTLAGTVTDLNGIFKLENVAIGRRSIRISFVGYEPVTLYNLNLTSGKELYLEVALEEDITQLEEVVVIAAENKVETNNSMALASARTFSIEESQRFAGARNDVARMATNYAGVSTANDNVNDIVIRGNSPDGLLWKLEGINIPNPNHFGFYGSTGGPVGMLNNNLLANSDFFTGAFPAEYGNALSGVFDLQMRRGNSENHEFTGQVGFNGFELGAEGPLKRQGSSFLINYRYSTLAVMAAMGMEFGTGTAVPYYQDLSFKVSTPVNNNHGRITLFGLGGLSKIDLIESQKDTTDQAEDFYGYTNYDIYNKNNMAVAGLSYQTFLNKDQYVKMTLAGTTSSNANLIDSVVTANQIIPFSENRLKNSNIIVDLLTNKKYNARLSSQYGLNYQRIIFNFFDSLYIRSMTTTFTEKGSSDHYQGYIQSKYKFSEHLTVSAGIHGRLLGLNKNYTIEPRAGIKYAVNNNNSLSFGYGMHSLLPPLFLFTTKVTNTDNTKYQPNMGLSFIKAHHYVMSLDHNFTSTVRLKIEPYYQTVFNAVVEKSISSWSSLNNSSMNFQQPNILSNTGTGRNAGVDITMEKFMDKGSYFLGTLSLYDSKYKGSDGILRSTAFDGGYVVNLLGGKEFELGQRKNKKSKKEIKSWLILDGKVAASGGQRYTPVDMLSSQAQLETVYLTDQAFSEQFGSYFRADFRIAIRRDSRKVSQEWAFDVQNATNRKNPLFMRYNVATNQEEITYQLGFFPMMQYKIYF
ncbi:MAG: TonB-dependent receptor [Cyclobacteriaceae bacterium]|nr:TonB-dependent receptor [Cyclobacteriaceae bacterium]